MNKYVLMATNIEIPNVLDQQIAAIIENEGYASKSEFVRAAIREQVEDSDYEFAKCQECGTVGFTWDAQSVPGDCPYCSGGPFLNIS